jgi:hypothetical protein
MSARSGSRRLAVTAVATKALTTSLRHDRTLPDPSRRAARSARRAGVDRDSYCLDGGHPAERYVLDDRRSEWVVYYSERGLESRLRSFPTEEPACRYLSGLLLADPTTRGR